MILDYKTHIATFICCFLLLLIVVIAGDRAARITLSTYYLMLAYGLFFILSLSKLICLVGHYADKKNLFTWCNKHDIALSVVIGVSLMMIIEESHEVRHHYNLAASLAFGLLLLHMLFYVHARFVTKMSSNVTGADAITKKGYFIYALFLALNFFNSAGIDNSDPYGPHFQLRFVFWVLLVHLIFSWILGQWKLVKQLKNERTDAELAHLKSQINPHFLFNTLNNLYGLALEKSDKTPGLILKLSGMLRYTLYQGTKDHVSLAEDIRYLNDFIELQQVRYHKKVNIAFKQQLDHDGYQISPLMLILLLENAYKHGVEKLTGDAFVNINLQVSEHLLVFNIDNNFDADEPLTAPGIGLENLQRRLSLVYPDQHQLSIDTKEGVYKVQLELELH